MSPVRMQELGNWIPALRAPPPRLPCDFKRSQTVKSGKKLVYQWYVKLVFSPPCEVYVNPTQNLANALKGGVPHSVPIVINSAELN